MVNLYDLTISDDMIDFTGLIFPSIAEMVIFFMLTISRDFGHLGDLQFQIWTRRDVSMAEGRRYRHPLIDSAG